MLNRENELEFEPCVLTMLMQVKNGIVVFSLYSKKYNTTKTALFCLIYVNWTQY